MKSTLQHLLMGLGCCCACSLVPGCLPLPGTGTVPNWYPGQPIGIVHPPSGPGAPPWYPVLHPPFPGGPGTPIVMNPVPGPRPVPPQSPTPNPGTTPTIPISRPIPAPTVPTETSNDFWSPWPLPPRGNQLAVLSIGSGRDATEHTMTSGSMLSNDGDLRYRGGRIIRHLSYVNLYVSGDTEWSATDVERIDRHLSAAMRDEHLNNVLLQYYNNEPISSTALPSHPLVGYTPRKVTRGDIQQYVAYLHRQGFLRDFDLDNTVFNFLLPPGTILTSDAVPADRSGSEGYVQPPDARQQSPVADAVDSLAGLGGYHGSVVTADGGRIYYAVGVYSRRDARGAANGIPVFGEPWKNVVATLYHQLIEARTDPDVEDAMRNSSDLNADRNLGWVSDAGLEIGDIPLRADVPITQVIKEVPLADGSGTVPVQLPYSNFVRGVEGPIPQPHPLP